MIEFARKSDGACVCMFLLYFVFVWYRLEKHMLFFFPAIPWMITARKFLGNRMEFGGETCVLEPWTTFVQFTHYAVPCNSITCFSCCTHHNASNFQWCSPCPHFLRRKASTMCTISTDNWLKKHCVQFINIAPNERMQFACCLLANISQPRKIASRNRLTKAQWIIVHKVLHHTRIK